jgi:hypothetical protein
MAEGAPRRHAIPGQRRVHPWCQRPATPRLWTLLTPRRWPLLDGASQRPGNRRLARAQLGARPQGPVIPRYRRLRLKLPLPVDHLPPPWHRSNPRSSNEEWGMRQMWVQLLILLDRGLSKFQSIETATNSFRSSIPSLPAREYQRNEINQQR